VATGTPVLYADFSGGINLEAGPYLLQESECQDARNVRSNRLGSLEKRNGCATLSEIKNATPAYVLGGPAHSLFAVNTSTPYLLAAGPHTTAGTDAIVSISTGGTATAIKTDAAAGQRWEWVQAPVNSSQGPIFGINGVDDPQYWTAATGSTSLAEWTAVDGDGDPIVGDHPAKKSRYLIYHLDKVWASGDPDSPGTVRSTGVDAVTGLPNPRNWDSEFKDDIDPFDGEAITGLGKIGPYLLVTKNRKTYVLTDPVSRSYRPISSTVGCCAHRTIVETNGGTMFLSEDVGVCVTDGSTVRTISDKIQPLLDAAARAYPTALRNAAATYYQDSYWLSLPTADEKNDLLLEYSLETNSWWIHTCPSNQFAILDPINAPKLFSTRPDVRRVDEMFVSDTYTDGAEVFLSYWRGPYWAWGQPHLNKRMSQLRIDGLGQYQTFIARTFEDEYYELSNDGVLWESADDDTSAFGGSGDYGGSGLYGPPLGVNNWRFPTPSEGWGRAWSILIGDGIPASLDAGINSETNGSANKFQIYSIAAFSRARTD
jgi:hypothetical protein